MVSVKLTGQQRRFTSHEEIHVPLTRAGNVAALLDFLKKNYPELPLPVDSCMAIVNDQACPMDSELKKNDSVSFMPLFGGG